MRRIGQLGLISGSIILIILLSAEKEFVLGCSSSNKNTETENETETEDGLRSAFKGKSCTYGTLGKFYLHEAYPGSFHELSRSDLCSF